MRRVLLTGATGLVGSEILRLLSISGIEVLCTTRNDKIVQQQGNFIKFDLYNITEENKDIILSFKADTLVHLAWDSTGHFSDYKNFIALKSTIDLAETFIRAGGKRIVVAGTYAEYIPGKVSEDSIISPQSFYAKCKNLVYQNLECLCSYYGVQLIYTRLFSVFGIEKTKGRLTHDILESIKHKKTITLNNPYIKRDFIYAPDVATKLIDLLNKTSTSGVYNIGTGISTSLLDYVNVFSEVFSYHDIYVNTKSTNYSTIVADNKLINDTLNNSNYTCIFEAVKDIKRKLKI